MPGRRRLGFIEPMKAASTVPPPPNGLWLYELKFDGYRALAVKNGREVELWSRNKNRLDPRFPEIMAALQQLRVKNCILDGEICALDARGKSSFQLLQNQENTGVPVVFYLFDVLHDGTRDLQDLPLLKRQMRLAQIMARAAGPLRSSASFEGDPEKILRTMEAAGAEGAIAKLKNSPYRAGERPATWIKIKFQRSQEFVIVGYTLPGNSRKYFGALLLGYYRGKKLIFAGRVGTGFTGKTLQTIHRKLAPLEVDQLPLENLQKPSGRWRRPGWKAAEERWVEPRLVAQVRFTEWTEDGLLRHPSFLGLREDKSPRQIVREPQEGSVKHS